MTTQCPKCGCTGIIQGICDRDLRKYGWKGTPRCRIKTPHKHFECPERYLFFAGVGPDGCGHVWTARR